MNRGSSLILVLVCLAAVTAGCASTGATPHPFPTPNIPAASGKPAAPSPDPNPPPNPSPSPAGAGRIPRGTPHGNAVAYNVTGTALSLRGTPYKNGGSDPGGFDCSGFVRYVFAQNGVAVPRTVSEQFHAGRQVDGTKGLEPGDLVFFSTVANGATHVGIALGGDEFVHAPSSTGEVRVERMSASYWATRFVGARRLL